MAIETFLATLNPHFRVLNVPHQVTPSRPPSRRLRSGAPSAWRSARRQHSAEGCPHRGPSRSTVPTTEQKATIGGSILMAFSTAATSPAITSAKGCPHRGPSRSTSRPPSKRLRSGAPSSWRSARRQRRRQSRLQRGALIAAHQEAPSRPPSKRLRSGAPSSWRSARRQRRRQSRLQRGALTAAHQEASCWPPSRRRSATPVGASALWWRLAQEVKTMRAFPLFNPIAFSSCSGLYFGVRNCSG